MTDQDSREHMGPSEALVPIEGQEGKTKNVTDSIKEWTKYSHAFHIDPCAEHPKREPFAITGGGSPSGQRVYFITDPESGEVKPKARWNFYDQDFHLRSALIIDRENEGRSGIDFSNMGRIALDEYIGDRNLELDYSPEGDLIGLAYNLYVSNDTNYNYIGVSIHREAIKKIMDSQELEAGDILINSDLKGDKFDFQYKDGKIHFSRSQGDNVTDEIVIPTSVDVEDLQIKFSPNQLVKNPNMFDDTYDVDWKSLDPIQTAGIRWEALGNDTFDSLVRNADEPAL